MFGDIILATTFTFVKVMSPIAAVLSIILFLKPSLFMNIEKKLSAELGTKKISRKTLEALEKENLHLHEMLVKYNRFVGIGLFIVSLYIIVKLY